MPWWALTESAMASMRCSVPGSLALWATVRRICMSDALSFAEIDGQHAELLPARTVLSLLSMADPSSDDNTVVTSSACTASNQGVLGALIGGGGVSCVPASTTVTD